MRCMFGRKPAALFAFFVLCATALSQQKVNPSNQVSWPNNCAASGVMVYNWLTNTCIPVSTSVNPIVYMGTWSGTTTYASNNAVYYAGSQYISLVDTNLNQTPGSSPLAWAILVSGGGNVSSVFGRTGVVTPQSGDYSFSQIAGTALASQLPLATSLSAGAVRPDGSTCTVTGGVLSCSGSGAVPSVFGRTGAITAAANDYNFSQLAGAAAVSQLPTATNSTKGILQPDGSTCTVTLGTLTCNGTGAVSSVFGRTGAVTPTTGDYAFGQIAGTAAPSQLPAATSSAQGAIRPDNSSCTVTAGVLTCAGSGGGGMSGQTPDYLPKAATATTSTTSSHFFDNATTAGLSNQGFLQQLNTANCQNNGVTFTATGCDEFDILNDGAVARGSSRNLTGIQMSGQFYGPGGDGTSEGRTSTLFGNSFNAAFITPGIKLTQVSNMNHFGIGDSQGFQISEAMHAGTAYQSDQGSQLIYAWVGELGHWSGTVAAGGTNTLPKVTSSTAHSWCSSQQNQSCVGSPGGVMLDRSVVRATGNMTGVCAGGPVAWMGSCPTDQTTLPITTVYGTALGINLTTGSTWDAPISRTITIGFGGGTGTGLFAAGDHACVIGDKFFEQRIITAVSGSAGAQTLTLPLSQTENSVFIAKGDCMYLTMDADQAHDIEMSTPSISLDGAHVLSSSPGFSMMFAVSASTTPDHWSRFDGGSSSGFHLYAGARIDKIDTTQPTFNPWQDTTIVYTLEPNSAFNVGDAICSPDFYGQKVDGMELTAGQNQPGQVTGIRLHITGHGASSGAAALRFYNDEAIGSYTPWGGPLAEPALMTQEGAGAFNSIYSGNYTPLDSVIAFGNHQPGQTSYYLLNDPSWGKIWLVSGNGIHVDQDMHGVSFWGAGIGGFTTGLQAGAGDGAGNNAGTRFAFGNGTTAPVWLAPCYSLGNINDHLCLTHQGAARVAGGGDYSAPADGILEVANIVATGTGRNLFGAQGWAKTTPTSAASSLTLDNGASDTPNLTFYYANHHNFSMDSADTAAGGFGTCTTAGNILRLITDADETGGAVRLCMDSVGNTAISGNFQAAQVLANQVLPGTLYSAAGTALPACAVGLKGATAVVTDATAPTYMGAYTSGGAITAAVLCSYNGTTYSWLTH